MGAPRDPEKYALWKKRLSEGTKAGMKRSGASDKIKAAMTGKKRKPFSNATKTKMSKFQKEKIVSAETESKMSVARKLYWQNLPDADAERILTKFRANIHCKDTKPELYFETFLKRQGKVENVDYVKQKWIGRHPR